MNPRIAIKVLYQRAIKLGEYRGLKEEAEDFAGWLIQGYLENKHRHQTIDQSLIDYRRQQHGDPRTSFYSQKRNAESFYEPLYKDDSQIIDSSGPSDNYSESDFGELPSDRERHVDASNFLEGRDCEIFKKYFEDEINKKEIGRMFSISESRVCQILKRAKKEVERWLLFHKMKEKIEMGETKLEIDWISF